MMFLPLLAAVFKVVFVAAAIRFFTKIVLSLGIGIVTYRVADNFWEQMKYYFEGAYNSFPQVAVQLLDLGGFTTGLNVLFSAVSFLIGIYSVETAFRVFGK